MTDGGQGNPASQSAFDCRRGPGHGGSGGAGGKAGDGGRGGRGAQPAGAGAPPAGGRGQGGGRGNAGPSLPQHMNAELTILLGKKKTALEIRDFLSGEFEPVPLADVMAVLRARESTGQIKLIAKPGPATAGTKKKG